MSSKFGMAGFTLDVDSKRERYRILRMTLPHVLLIVLLCLYVLFGAVVLYKIELPEETAMKIKGKMIVDRLAVNFIDRIFDNNDTKDDVKIISKTELENLLNIYTKSVVKIVRSHYLDHSTEFDEKSKDLWTLSSSVLFAWSIISTIGYGNTSPVTFSGRLFCLFYGVLGIPFAMVVVANMGKFFNEAFNYVEPRCRKIFRRLRRCFKIRLLGGKNAAAADGADNASLEAERRVSFVSVTSANSSASSSSSAATIDRPMPLQWMLVFVILYLVVGGFLLPLWERQLDFFAAFYFAFISITTTGLGDIVPKNEAFLVLTIFYTAIGVAISTLFIGLLSGYMRKLHYVGRRIKGAKFARVRFNGSEMSVVEFLGVLGRRYSMTRPDVRKIADDLDFVMQAAIKGKDITPDEATVMVIDRAKMQNHHGNGTCGGEFYGDVFYKNNNFPPKVEKAGLFNKVLRRLSEPFRRLKGAFNVSAEDILFIDDERLLNFWRENYTVTPT